MRSFSRLLSGARKPKNNGNVFGLKPRTGADTKYKLQRTNLESEGQGMLGIGTQHLGALSAMQAKISSLQQIKATLTAINLESREPTAIELAMLTQQARSTLDLESMTFDDFARPIGFFNMEAEGDEEEENEEDNPDANAGADDAGQTAAGEEGADEGQTNAGEEGSEEPQEPAEPDDAGQSDEGASAADDDGSGEPQEPGEPSPDENAGDGTGDAGNLDGTEDQPADTGGAPDGNTSEADINKEPEGEPLPPEHKVNVVMRAGEVEINIEDAMQQYIGIAESFHEDVRVFTQEGYVSAQNEIKALGDKLVALRSTNAMTPKYDVEIHLDHEYANVIAGAGCNFTEDVGSFVKQVSDSFKALTDNFLSQFYLKTIPEALAQYEAGNYAAGADAIIYGIKGLCNFNILGYSYSIGLIPGSDTEIIATNKTVNLKDGQVTTFRLATHTLTALNNAAIGIAEQVAGSSFLQDFHTLEQRAAAIVTAPGFAGTEGDPRYYVNQFSPTFHLMNVYILTGIRDWLKALVEVNEQIASSN